MSVKGFSTQKKLKSGDYPDQSEFSTLQKMGSDRVGLDIIQNGAHPVALLQTFEAGTTLRNIKLTAHVARKGDLLRVTSGLNIYQEFGIIGIVDANNFIIAGEFSSIPVATVDQFNILRYVTAAYDSSGSLVTSSGPIQFTKNAVPVLVSEDTVTPANNIPLPVKLIDAGGPILIDVANQNLHVQMDHDSGNPDSVRIGDGVEEWAINAALEGTVHDADALAQLVLILAKIIAAPATEAKQDALIAKFGAIGQQLSAASAAVVLSTEQEAILTAIQTAGEKYLSPVDFLDAGAFIPATTTIPKSSSNAVICVVGLAAGVKKIQVIEDIGSFMALYSDAARTNLLCYLPLAGGEVEVTIAAATAIYIGAVYDVDITTASTALMINFLG